MVCGLLEFIAARQMQWRRIEWMFDNSTRLG